MSRRNCATSPTPSITSGGSGPAPRRPETRSPGASIARIALAGHSAGASVSMEAAIDAVGAGIDIAGLVLLDGVPWPRTAARVHDLPPLAYLSLRSEPGPCNAFGSGATFTDASPVPVDDLTIAGATHCDPENPTDGLCALACGGASIAGTLAYQRLLYQFLQDRLPVTPVEASAATFDMTVDALVAVGFVRLKSGGPAALPRLKVNGESPASGIVSTTGTAQVTLDVFTNAAREPVHWYLAGLGSGRATWITPGGPSSVPEPIAFATPRPLQAVTMGTLTFVPGEWAGAALPFVRDGAVIASSAIVAVR